MSPKKDQVFSVEEMAAMRERAREEKAAARANKDMVDPESEVLAKIDEMEEPDRSMATRIHEIIKTNVPSLTPRTWYGMPAYAKDGKVVCFFQPAQKFKARYSTLGFNDSAKLDDGEFWPVAFALKHLTPAEEEKITELVKKAAG